MLLQEQTATHLADLFSALSDPTRLQIISVLQDSELNVGDIAAQLTMTDPAVSHQLRAYVNCGWCAAVKTVARSFMRSTMTM